VADEVRSYRDLRVWQAGIELVEAVYRVTQCFPKSEVYGLASQMRRAAVSVPSNIAESHAREHLKEYLHHISMAQGSIAELDTQIEIACRLDYIDIETSQEIAQQSRVVRAQLYALRNALMKNVG